MVNCKTCEQTLAENANYCMHCGAKSVGTRLTITALLKSFAENVINWDAPFIKTTTHLLKDPKKVTQAYIDGVRKIINSPIRYGLFALTLYGVFQFLFSDFLDTSTHTSFLSGIKEGYLESNKDVDRIEKVEAIFNWTQSRNQLFNFIYIPFLALTGKLIFRKNRLNFAEHLVIAIYAVSLTVIANVCIGCIVAPIQTSTAKFVYHIAGFFINLIGIFWVHYHSLNQLAIRSMATILIATLLMMVFFLASLLFSLYIIA